MLLSDEPSCDPRHTHVTTSAQRDRFRRALRRAREEAGLSQRALARAVGRTHGAAWQWEEGRGAPDPATVARLEELLGLQPNSLAQLVGYVPHPPEAGTVASVTEAVDADPRLGESERELLTAVYRWLVRHRSTTAKEPGV
jgi:transcriptional regulator with XRE-family HTH domain